MELINRQALDALARSHPDRSLWEANGAKPGSDAVLLRWAATLEDAQILDMPNVGKGTLRWIRAHAPKTTAPDSLDAAWAEAEAALPEGWSLAVDRGPLEPRHVSGSACATATERTATGEGRQEKAFADSPAAALHALAAKLQEGGGR
jgi:hypothetical protein